MPRGTTDRERVLAVFMVDGRLTAMPRRAGKRRIVLDEVAQRFDVGQHYSEPEVNQVLRKIHEDVAALRRYLVDEGLLDRDHGEYWRAGGEVDVD